MRQQITDRLRQQRAELRTIAAWFTLIYRSRPWAIGGPSRLILLALAAAANPTLDVYHHYIERLHEERRRDQRENLSRAAVLVLWPFHWLKLRSERLADTAYTYRLERLSDSLHKLADMMWPYAQVWEWRWPKAYPYPGRADVDARIRRAAWSLSGALVTLVLLCAVSVQLAPVAGGIAAMVVEAARACVAGALK